MFGEHSLGVFREMEVSENLESLKSLDRLFVDQWAAAEHSCHATCECQNIRDPNIDPK